MNKTHIIANETQDVSPEEATQDFILRTEELLAQLKDGRHTLDHAILSAMVIALPEDIATVTDPQLRATLEANPKQSGIETTIGAGDPNRMLETVSRLPELFSQSLIQEHHQECQEEDCSLNDPEIAPYIGTLKAMAMVYARASRNLAATQLLVKSLKDMGRKALRVAELHEGARQELGGNDLEDAKVMALAGDQAMQFMRLLAEAGLLPEEATTKIRADIAEYEKRAGTGMDVEEHTSGKKVTVIKNGPSTKQ
jgi:hypothetical protein